jgi:hypothetical protein
MESGGSRNTVARNAMVMPMESPGGPGVRAPATAAISWFMARLFSAGSGMNTDPPDNCHSLERETAVAAALLPRYSDWKASE